MLDWFDKYEFYEVWVLWFLLIIPLFIIFYLMSKEKVYEPITTSSLSLFKGIKSNIKWVNHVKFFLKMTGLFFLIIAAARPQESLESISKREISKDGIEIIIAMDASGSMLAEDFKPNRFEASKKLANEFIKDRENDKMGLVIFEGEAYTQCPLTNDKKVLMDLVNEAKQGIVEGGTAIGTGLGTAINRLKESNSKSKVIILLTDGVSENDKISPENAADIAKELKIRVYTIGVGTNGKAKTPVAIDPIYNNYIYDSTDVKIDESTLKKIATKTGGKYFRATDNEKLKSIYKEINLLEKTKITTTEYDVDLPEKSYLFIIFGLTAFFIEYIYSKIFVKSIS